MTVLQILVNLVLAVIVYLLAGYLLGMVGVVGVLNFLISLVLGVLTFVANPAARLGVK